ncbi:MULTISPECIES: porin [Cupriavidus]|uniref:porin n=1 Tax=Cupriavidus TaxID=106589 RepID=UPI0009DC3E4D|nr:MULTISPECIES: porin [Cupriavidus]
MLGKRVGLLCVATVVSCGSASSWAEADSMVDIQRLVLQGVGPGALGVMPGRSMLSLYGTVDVGLDYTHGPSGNMKRVESNNAWTSKFGIYGQESLGRGLTAFFRLESGFNPDSGTQQSKTSFFNRGSFVGLSSTDWGTVSLGKQLSGASSLAIGADPFLATGHQSIYSYLAAFSDLGYGSSLDINRINNSISYTTPLLWEHVGINAFYALKGNQDVGPRTHNQSLSIYYASQENFMSASYSQNWCDPSPAATSQCSHDATREPSIRTDNVLLNVSHDFGFLTGTAVLSWINPRNTGGANAMLYFAGVQKKIGAHLLRVTAGFRDTTQKANHAWGMTFGDDYFLSKRTSLYARFGFIRNSSASALTYNYEPENGFPLPKPGGSVHSLTVGIAHHF